MPIIVRTKGACQQEKRLISIIFVYNFGMKKVGRPKKQPGTLKAEYIEVRCEASEKESFRGG